MPQASNYIQDTNPFKLAGPPSWWLRLLRDFDASLVVVPSRQTCVYRLAQRRRLNLPEHITNDALFNESDTKMLASYSLVPVTTILPTANWSNPLLFKELGDRAPWRQGGAEKVNARLDAADAAHEASQARKTDEVITHQAKEGWKRYRKLTGLGRTLFT